MRKSLLVVVVLLCVASLMAAMAYTSATLRNQASFKVSNTDAALLAIRAGDHAAAGYTSGSTSKELVINWAKGNNGEFGVQSGSVYIWENLFYVKNNADHPVKVSITVPKDSATPEPNIFSKVYIRVNGTDKWVIVASRHTTAYGNKLEFELQPGQEVGIDSMIDSMQRTLGNGVKSFNLQVLAARIENKD